ncbi:hillarin [Lingula anatina]|uniref:Hillarin n=1 Tax=Lingula anatina TaxID=7574 RepID=A0A1S3HQB5_LINAN|nr:hillarin [Lingula anatina]|eukprot:XP_013387731.1 hillarin [Lingula anatina]
MHGLFIWYPGNRSAFIDDDCHYETLRIRAGADNRKNLDDKMMHMIQTLTARDRAKFRMFMQELYGPDFDRMQPGGDQEALVNNSERHYAKPYGRRGSGADLSQYDPLDASQPPFLAEMLAQQATISSPDGTLRTRPSTSSTGAHAIPEEAKKDKIFIAQNELELKQREEENKIFKDFENRRESEIKRLEREIRGDLEHAVKNLLKEMDRGYFTGDFNKEKYQIEEHFKTLKQDRLQDLLSDLSAQERDRLSGMIDKQSSEMLQLISKKHKSMVPPPRPPTTKKAELIANSASFENVDHQAIEVASWDQNSFTELVFWLVRSCKNEVEKARAIFRWITVKDLNKMLFFGNIDPSSPFFLLRGIKYGLESYHDLFKRLCSYAGLHCHVIQGYSKSFGYKPGMPIADERFRNQWTVVYVDGSWRFVDTHWGARRINSGLRGGGGGGGEGSSRSDPSRGSYAGMGAEDDAAKSQECSYEYDDFYFLTDPEDFIHQHYPDDPNWQLLEEPITMEDFVQMPLLKSHFFHYGLSLRSHQSAMVSTDTGKVDIVLGCETPDRLSFTTRLQSEGEILDRFAIHHIVDNKIIFNVNIPRRGDHTLTIFANDSRSSSEVYNSICIFGIRCDYIEPDSKFRFPLLPLGVGSLPAASALGLELESHQEPFIESRGELVIDLGFEKPVKVNHKLLCGNYDYHDDNFDRFAFQQYREKMAVSYVIRFPEQGYYAFSIYAAELEDSNPTMDCLYSYLIFCPKQPECPPKVSPKALTRWMKCRLHEPIYGDLKLNKNIKFKVEVPGAKKVAVIIKGKWYYLKSTNRVIWEGAVFTGKDLDMAYVFANFDGLNFLPLLEYTLMR